MNILQIGTGGCGNKLVNTAINIASKRLDLINSYDYLFINSNDNEIKVLPNANKSNTLALNGNGTGKDRDKAKISIQRDKPKFMNHFSKIEGKYDFYEIYLSGDGGFGSGSVVALANVIKNINPTSKVNLRFAFPKLNSRRISLQNAIDLYYDVVKLVKAGVVNSVTIIDNNKMEDEEEFNLKCMGQILDALEFHGGGIDENDAYKVNCASKYTLYLPLRETKPLDEAVDYAVANSPFVTPSSITSCSHMVGLVNKECFHKDDPLELLLVKDFDKTDYSDSSRLLLGGLQMPNKYVTLYEKELEKTELLDEEDDDDLNFKPKFKKVKTNTEVATEEIKEETKLKRMQNMISEDFWNI